MKNPADILKRLNFILRDAVQKTPNVLVCHLKNPADGLFGVKGAVGRDKDVFHA